MTFPFRLILIAYGFSALVAAGGAAAGGGAAMAVLVFWLGGTAALFVLPAVLPGLRQAAAIPNGMAAWQADLIAERTESRRQAMLSAWDTDATAEASAASTDRRRTDRRAG
jgi:hypothetical protein